jgi:hypothetical protein
MRPLTVAPGGGPGGGPSGDHAGQLAATFALGGVSTPGAVVRWLDSSIEDEVVVWP